MQTLITRRAVLAGLAALLGTPAWAQEAGEVYTGFEGTLIRFASVPTARELLMSQDEWMGATSEFQRQAVMLSAAPVTLEAFRRWNGDAARPWAAAQQTRWRQALAVLAPAFRALRIPLPKEVWLVSSNGQESANAPYTRGNFVVLPESATFPGYRDAMLMAHELWHVASRHTPLLATRLYAELGFGPIPQLVFPEAWASVRIANPDAPENRHAMRVAIQGRKSLLTPVLVAARTTLQAGETFFNVMQVRLLEVAPDAAAGVSQAVLRDGQPVWYPLNAPHDYLRQLGGNTDYVIHVEEALADNIAMLATGASVRNPQLLERIKAVLLGSSRT